jgi:hypothetical protein
MRGILMAPLFGVVAVGMPMLLLTSGLNATSNPLERTAWSVTVAPDELAQRVGMEPFDDTLLFRKNTLALERHPLVKRCAYRTARSASGWSFTAPPDGGVEAAAVWSGEVVGDTIAGVLSKAQPSGEMVRFTFRGQREAALDE